MICRVKVLNTGLSIYHSDGSNFPVDGKEFDAFKFLNNQVIILHPGGSLWLDKGQVQEIEVARDEPDEKLSGLRSLIGQDMKQIAIEFK